MTLDLWTALLRFFHGIREIGPYSDRSASDNQSLIWLLVDLDEHDPFELVGCGLDFIDVTFQAKLRSPNELAEHLMRVSPATAERFDSVEQFSRHLATTHVLRIYCGRRQIRETTRMMLTVAALQV